MRRLFVGALSLTLLLCEVSSTVGIANTVFEPSPEDFLSVSEPSQLSFAKMPQREFVTIKDEVPETEKPSAGASANVNSAQSVVSGDFVGKNTAIQPVSEEKISFFNRSEPETDSDKKYYARNEDGELVPITVLAPEYTIEEVKDRDYEIEATKLAKGSEFWVKSDRQISSSGYNDGEIEFDTMYRVFPGKDPEKVTFRGRIVKNSAAKSASAGKIKIKVEKIVVNKIVYPVEAEIIKVDGKNVKFGVIAGGMLYPQNIRNAAQKGNDYVRNVYHDPCDKYCNDDHPLMSPLYLAGGALMQTSAIIAAPVVGLFGKRDDVTIKEQSSFLIKIEKDLYIVDI